MTDTNKISYKMITLTRYKSFKLNIIKINRIINLKIKITMIKYIITNNFKVLYNTKKEAEEAFKKEISKLEPLQRAAFKFLYTVAPYRV